MVLFLSILRTFSPLVFGTFQMKALFCSQKHCEPPPRRRELKPAQLEIFNLRIKPGIRWDLIGCQQHTPLEDIFFSCITGVVMTDGSVEYNIRTKRVGCEIRRAMTPRESDISKRVDYFFQGFTCGNNQSINQSVSQSVSQSVHPSINQSINQSIYLSIYLNLSIYLSIYPYEFIYISV